jgi:hypothetical protein
MVRQGEVGRGKNEVVGSLPAIAYTALGVGRRGFLPRAPRWKSQIGWGFAAFGRDQIVRIFRGKKKFPIPLEAEKKNFNHRI